MRRPKVLVVDDDPSVLTALEDELADHYAVTTATAGEEALALLESRDFDAVISDVRMPGIDGVEVVRRAQVLRDNLVRILLTGYADDSALAAARSPAGVYKLSKPWGEELEIVLRRALEQRERLREFETRLDRERLARERAQVFAVRLDKMALLGTLTASVAHELRSPLAYLSANLEWLNAAVLELSQLLEAAGAAAESAAGATDPAWAVLRERWAATQASGTLGDLGEVCGDCLGGLRRLTQIVEGLHAYAAPSRRRPEPVNICECVDLAARMVSARYKRDVKIRTSFAPDVPWVIGHEGEFTQIVINLMINGIQAMGEKGSVEVRAARRGDWVEIEVLDQGPGIPDPVRARIFEPFFTTKAETDGTGLGLSISREIARRYGGELLLASTGAQGTTFVVRLPVPKDHEVRP